MVASGDRVRRIALDIVPVKRALADAEEARDVARSHLEQRPEGDSGR